MKWWNNFNFIEKAAIIANLFLLGIIYLLIRNGFLPQFVGVLFILLVAVGLLLSIALLINRK